MEDFKSAQEKIQAALVATTRLTNEIASEDLGFHRTSNPTVASELDDASLRLFSLTSAILKSATKNTDLPAPELEDADDVDVHWSRIVDVVDNLLEKADTCLDEYTGLIKKKNTAIDHAPSALTTIAKKSPYALDQSLRRANIIKPQNAFERKPNNLDTSPWKPFLTKKPHATIPLKKSLGTFNDESQTTQYKHPYETEILSLEYPETVFQKHEPIQPLPFESTSATFVDTFDGVLKMLDELKGATEIAIDTEHHDFRTYSGLLSLMQISTREKDWIVDTLQPWRHKLEVLNEVFADPSIVKVLHGAYMDIIWLQRDCGLYIVGLFDTHEAAYALQYPAKSLAYLLKRHVNFDADKKYQLADWRIRPLPDEMFYYARSDTHYLLYIYDCLRNEVLSSSPLLKQGQATMGEVLDKSKEVSLRRHVPYVYDANTGQGPLGWYNLLTKHSTTKFTNEQFAVFRAVHQWRDDLARKEDESPLFIMSNVNLVDIVRRLPPDAKALHGLLESSAFLARRAVSSLFDTITKARAEGLHGPSVSEFFRRHSSSQNGLGIGETARKVFPDLSHRSKDPINTKDLVSQSSRLWGNIPMSSRWDPDCKAKASSSIRFELPWAKFIQSGKVVEETAPDVTESTSNGVSELQALEDPRRSVAPEDGEFTLKNGVKRKAPQADSSSEEDEEDASGQEVEAQKQGRLKQERGQVPADDEIAISDEDSDQYKKQGKKQRRAERKALKKAQMTQQASDRRQRKIEKRAKREREKSAASVKEEAEDIAPFDYSKARSVLNPERTKNVSGDAKQPKAKFNPYGMNAEGPKPARRMHGEKPGRSQTFTK